MNQEKSDNNRVQKVIIYVFNIFDKIKKIIYYRLISKELFQGKQVYGFCKNPLNINLYFSNSLMTVDNCQTISYLTVMHDMCKYCCICAIPQR